MRRLAGQREALCGRRGPGPGRARPTKGLVFNELPFWGWSRVAWHGRCKGYGCRLPSPLIDPFAVDRAAARPTMAAQKG